MRGELHDALCTFNTMGSVGDRLLPDPNTIHSWVLLRREVPE